jgi:site-specific DNA-methyltransferase (adenine-specific)
MVLKNGKGAYKNQDNAILDILKEIDAEPVWRNKGIDGFLRIDGKMKPIPVRIQRNTETVESAKHQMKIAITKNGFKIAVLYRTTGETETTLFSMLDTDDDRFYVFDKIDDLVRFKRELVTA